MSPVLKRVTQRSRMRDALSMNVASSDTSGMATEQYIALNNVLVQVRYLQRAVRASLGRTQEALALQSLSLNTSCIFFDLGRICAL